MELTRRSFIETAAGTAAAFATPGCATAALDAAAPVDIITKTHRSGSRGRICIIHRRAF